MCLLLLLWFRRIIWSGRSFRVSRNTACIRELLVVVRAIPIARPLPYISSHVVKSIAVGREAARSCDPDILIIAGVLVRKLPLERIRHPLSLRTKLISPYKRFAGEAAPRREFPLCLCRQSL